MIQVERKTREMEGRGVENQDWKQGPGFGVYLTSVNGN